MTKGRPSLGDTVLLDLKVNGMVFKIEGMIKSVDHIYIEEFTLSPYIIIAWCTFTASTVYIN